MGALDPGSLAMDPGRGAACWVSRWSEGWRRRLRFVVMPSLKGGWTSGIRFTLSQGLKGEPGHAAGRRELGPVQHRHPQGLLA